MANPQIENGYTKIANDIIENLAKIRIPGEATQCLYFILRKTYGYNKKSVLILLNQFETATGMKKPAICRALKKLQKMKLITIIKKDNANIYKLNKNYDLWKPIKKKKIAKTIIKKDNAIIKKDNTIIKKDNSIIKKDNLPLSKKLTFSDEPKYNKSKERKNEKKVGKKKKKERTPKSYFLEMFNSIKKNFTDQELKLAQEFLDYWTETNLHGFKERWEMEKTFDINRRFKTWIRNEIKWKKRRGNYETKKRDGNPYRRNSGQSHQKYSDNPPDILGMS